ncbi:MAG: hypothetical protein U5J96_15655 [Ignavibacteriaceae bacterium]|nr:hypothetical protein [Ignavibacteriaceae bacterium]
MDARLEMAMDALRCPPLGYFRVRFFPAEKTKSCTVQTASSKA